MQQGLYLEFMQHWNTVRKITSQQTVEVKGNIVEQSISILIYPGSTHSYITPRLVEICDFKKVKY